MLNIGVVIGLIKKLAPVASPEVIAQAVNAYMDDHPEIEVADGSITEEKLASDVALTLSTLESDVSDVKTAIQGISLLESNVVGASSTVTKDGSGRITGVTYEIDGNTVRTDTITYGNGTITEVRTDGEKTVTITTNLSTLAPTAEVA